MQHVSLCIELLRRELQTRYLGTFSGAIWIFLQPLAQLAIYAYVFGTIFRARLPEAEFGDIGFTAFLAVGLWPWLMFSESLSRASTAILDSAGLLGKVAFPRHLLVVAPVIAGTLLHLLGFAAVLLVLAVMGLLDIGWSWLWLLPLAVLLACFTLGVAWLTAALTVFVRDLSHLLAQILMLLFFLTPVLYPRSLIPEPLRPVADANPLAAFVGMFRSTILGTGTIDVAGVVSLALVALVALLLGWFTFRRLSPHFEDFL